uniref:Uncharacterized protein n=1 Tax=Anguilla anguilla TaxID=7936 RepID=A0A0E9QJP1_ANGAN
MSGKKNILSTVRWNPIFVVLPPYQCRSIGG